MAKELHIPACSALDKMEMEEACKALLDCGSSLSVDVVNWPKDYPYCPQTTIRLAHTDSFLFLRYDVKGQQLRAMTANDQGEVWCDSCVEFFCQVPSNDYYMNFETNCIARMVASRRKGKTEGVVLCSADEMSRIRRYASVGNQPFAEKDGEFAWTVCLAIPLDILSDKHSFPFTLRANFYKCADETKMPHFVSWSPIDLPNPNFHCPQFFGNIILD